MKNRDLTAPFVLAVSAQKKILKSIWTDLGQIHMSIFAAGRNCTEEQSVTLLNKTSDVRAYVSAHCSTTRKRHSHYICNIEHFGAPQ